MPMCLMIMLESFGIKFCYNMLASPLALKKERKKVFTADSECIQPAEVEFLNAPGLQQIHLLGYKLHSPTTQMQLYQSRDSIPEEGGCLQTQISSAVLPELAPCCSALAL